MKNRIQEILIFLLALFIIGSFIGFFIYFGTKIYRNHKVAEAIEHSSFTVYEVSDFNVAFDLDYDIDNPSILPDVNAVAETKLYVRVEVFNKKNNGNLTTEEVTDFIKDEVDTTNFEEDLPQNIKDYLYWYYYYDGNDDIHDYWNEISEMFSTYKYENPDNSCSKFSQLSLEQIQELERMTAEDDYSYSAILEGE